MASGEAAEHPCVTPDLLDRYAAGDRDAYNLLFETIYDDLRRRAHWMAKNAGRTLSTTAVVHEAYIKLAGGELSLNDESHFFALAARAMRQVVLNAARDRGAEKRGGNLVQTTMKSGLMVGAEPAVDFLSLEQALLKLSDASPRLAQVVELHFFAGLGFPEIARLLELSERTVARDWRAARAILQLQLDSSANPTDEPA
ncbi:MAG: ECF-type sigma factor [Lysobacteraceae bacterium]|nr:sigma-70 family RNA polymerase sigma factor [Xanthomonadales bacterium]HPF72373.1 ECF-type sigma factor [Xanthomonadaceae bacterium]HRX98983.1 ECF-type sigma factor [Xanthomonadaceae bacterium]